MKCRFIDTALILSMFMLSFIFVIVCGFFLVEYRGCRLDKGLSGYDAETLTIDHSG